MCRSRSVRLLHPKNITVMSVTWEVSKLLTSRLLSSLHWLNIPVMSVTWEVSKLCTSRLVSFSQPENMPPIDHTSDVSNAVPKVMDVAFAYPLNRYKQHLGACTPPSPAMYRSYAGACPVTQARTLPFSFSEISQASSGASAVVSRNVTEPTSYR